MGEVIEIMFIKPAFIKEDDYLLLKDNAIKKLIDILKINDYEYEDDIKVPDENKIKLTELSDDIRIPISNIPKLNQKYICKKCRKIPDIIKSKKEFFGLNLSIECHNESIELGDILDARFEDILNYIELINIKDNSNDKDKNEIILPFKTLNDLADFYLYSLLYIEMKDKIKELNFGETKNNMAFILFENSLSNVLYNKDKEENEKYFNNLSIFKTCKYNYFFIYNKIQVLSDGTKFYFKLRKEIPIKIELNEINSTNYEYNIYKLNDEMQCFLLGKYAIIIKGNLEKINFEEDINVFYFTWFDIDTEVIFVILSKRNLIYIYENLFLGIRNDYLFLIDFDKNSLCDVKLYISEEILKIIALEKKNIIPIKNKTAVQFLLIGKRHIFLMKFLIEQKKYEKIKEYKYIIDEQDEKYVDNFNYLIQYNKLFFSINNILYLFNLNTFELTTTIHFGHNCYFIKFSENYIICTTKKSRGYLLINLNNLKMEPIEFPCPDNALLPDLIINQRYLFFGLWIYDLKKKEYQIIHKDIPKIDECNHWSKMFFTCENQFCIYYIYNSKDGNTKSFIDFYQIE